MPLAALIPMTTLAAVLIMVAWNMCDWSAFFKLVKTAPKSDSIVLIGTFLLTVIFDLVIAIEVGIVVSSLLFMKRMAEVTDVYKRQDRIVHSFFPCNGKTVRDIWIVYI